jgi:hypothetical protein
MPALRRPARTGAALLALILGASELDAQVAPGPVPPSPYRTSVAANPFAPIFGGLSGEFETTLSPGFTLGAGGLADLSSGRERFTTLQAKLKYYPNEVALRGFAVGVTLGFVSQRDESTDMFTGERFGARTETAPTYGIVLDYNWQLGRQRRFLVGTGIGARRVLRNVGDDSPLSQYYPDGRLVLGWTF